MGWLGPSAVLSSGGVTAPTSGGMFGTGGDVRRQTKKDRPAQEELDPVVKWLNEKDAQLRDEAAPVRARQKKGMDYYLGKQTFNLAKRPRWMDSIVDNSVSWAVNRWAAMLTDNKPKFTFAALNPDEQEDVDIANAAFSDDYVRENYQARLEDAVKLSRIENKAFIRQVYDPDANAGRGAIVWIPVSGTQIYVNAEASCVDDAQLLMYEWVEPTAKVVAKYQKLKKKLLAQSYGAKDDKLKRIMSPAASTVGQQSESMIPGHAPGEVSTGTTYNSPYAANASPPNQSRSGQTKMREFWLKQPSKKTRVKRIMWTIGGEPATEPKTIQFYDKDGNPTHKEPLMTVVTEGNVVYEWPLSMAILTDHIGKHFGGLKVLAMYESRKVITEKKYVPLYPGGRRVVLAENFKASDGMNPYVDGHWPFAEIDAFRDGRKFNGLSDPDIIIPMQDAKNTLESILMIAAKQTSNPIWRVPFGRKTPNEMFTNMPGAIIDEDPTSLRYGKRESGPDMPAYVMQLLQYWDSRIEKVTGLTDIAQGGKNKGNQAAETVSMMQDAASLPARQGIRNVEQCLVKLAYQWLSLAQQFYTEPRWVTIKDSIKGDDKRKQFIGNKFSAATSIVAKAGSALPQNPSARLSAATQLMQTPFGSIEMFFETLEEVGLIDSASAAIKNVYKHRDMFVASRDDEKHPMGDPAVLIGMPGMLQVLMGGGGKKSQAQGGRTSRLQTPRPGRG